jgi:hypothetical protein
VTPNEYLRQLDDLKPSGSLASLIEWAEQVALPWFWSELQGMVGPKATPLAPVEAVRRGLLVTFKDLITKPREAAFYAANGTMFSEEARRFITAGKSLLQAGFFPSRAVSEREVAEGLGHLLFEAVVLLEIAAGHRHQLDGYYGAYSVGRDHTFPVFKAAEQAIYGRYSGLTHTDRAPFAPIAALRTAIELRVRRAFGLQSFLDQGNFGLTPISMSSIFDELFKFERQIGSLVDLRDVYRIYRWTNPYLHAGRKDFVWLAGYALQFLRPLFVGPPPTPRGGFNMDAGIEMPQEVWNRIRRPFEREAKRKGLILLDGRHVRPECVLH